MPFEAQRVEAVAGAWRDSRAPEQVFAYYRSALPANGWGIEKESSDFEAPGFSLVACRRNAWISVGVLPDRARSGSTLIAIGYLPPQEEGC